MADVAFTAAETFRAAWLETVGVGIITGVIVEDGDGDCGLTFGCGRRLYQAGGFEVSTCGATGSTPTAPAE